VKIIVGLGNPGITYKRTRHTVGFQGLDRLAEINHILISTKRFQSLYGTGWIDSEKVILIKPMTSMNRSGDAVKKILYFFQAGIEDLIVIHDDLDLPFGRMRFKQRGGDGGHQGVRSIVESIGKNTFLRLKIGIGRPPRGMDPADYVLAPFDEIQCSDLVQIVSRAAEALKVLLLEGVETAMSRYQKRADRNVPRNPALK
jgi:PTH1 family peptidyl-tRNA hydrolase